MSILGSLFGRSKKTEEKTTTRVNYKQMVADAEAAGFNPLTVLRNGGAAGHTTTTTPALSSPSVLGEALGHVGNFLSNFDPMADERREQEYQLVQAQIANLNESTAAMKRPQSFNVPSYTAGQIERRPSGSAGQLSRVTLPAIGPDVPAKPEQDEIVNPFPVGSGIEIPGHLKSADAWESLFSDPGGWIGAAYNAGAIWRHNAILSKKKWDRQWEWLSRQRDAERRKKLADYGDPYTVNPVFR